MGKTIRKDRKDQKDRKDRKDQKDRKDRKEQKDQKDNKLTSPIPKKIHFIWLGKKQPPYIKKFMKTFETYAPGYTLRLWGDKDITKSNFPKTFATIQKIRTIHGTNLKNYEKTCTVYDKSGKPYTYSKYAQISDLMRYEIVYREGGYYFDVNMYLVKDITKLFNRPEPLILCNELGENIEISDGVSNSFFGAIVKSPVLGRFLTKRFLSSIDLYNPEVDEETGPWAFHSIINFTKDNYHVFPARYFYPYIPEWHPIYKHHALRKSYPSKCSGKRKTKKFNLKMKPDLWIEFPCEQYKSSYGIKIWESGGSWKSPDKWYEKEQGKLKTVYPQTGGMPAVCVPCAVAAAPSISTGLVSALGALTGALVAGKNYLINGTPRKSMRGGSKRSKRSKRKPKYQRYTYSDSSVVRSVNGRKDSQRRVVTSNQVDDKHSTLVYDRHNDESTITYDKDNEQIIIQRKP